MNNSKKNMILDIVKPFAGLALLIAIFAVCTGGQTLSLNNIKIVTEQSLALIVAATGVFFIMTTGMMDLSIGAVVGLCCYVMANACKVSIPLGLALTLLTGLACGFFTGFATAVLKIPSFLASLCTMYIITGLLTYLISSGSVMVPIALADYNSFPIKFAITAVIFAAACIVYYKLPFGHNVRMIGTNELAAHYSAISVAKTKVLCFVIDGGLAACAAFLVGIRSGSSSLSTGSDMMFNGMVALTLGGFPFGGGAKSRLIAAIVGSLLLNVLSNGFTLLEVSATATSLIKGGLFLAIVLLSSSTFKNFVAKLKNIK